MAVETTELRISVTATAGGPLSAGTRRLLDRMLCPFTGLTQGIGFVLRGVDEPRVAIAGGDMTGVHHLRSLPPPLPGAHHIGGAGLTYEEAVIKTLGETAERYAHSSALIGGRQVVRRASVAELRAAGADPLVPPDLRWYADHQLSRPGFPFARLGPGTPIGWVQATSLIDGTERWVPAREAFVGYVADPPEPRFTAGVTTGSAAHTDPAKALSGALLEIVQVDAAMGHWYGRTAAPRLRDGRRTRTLRRLVQRTTPPGGPRIAFHWLPSPDLPGLAIACVLRRESLPHVAVGLGCDLRLERALYKAFLEAVAVAQLAKVILFRESVEGSHGADLAIYDLDSNVGRYARSGGEHVDERFGAGGEIDPEDVPADVALDPRGEIAHLVHGFAAAGLEVTGLDLTSRDIHELGFRVLRAWSPDTLSLSLPSAPPLAKARFAAYGGAADVEPHPYP